MGIDTGMIGGEEKIDTTMIVGTRDVNALHQVVIAEEADPDQCHHRADVVTLGVRLVEEIAMMIVISGVQVCRIGMMMIGMEVEDLIMEAGDLIVAVEDLIMEEEDSITEVGGLITVGEALIME